jgi:hypothetical protein
MPLISFVMKRRNVYAVDFVCYETEESVSLIPVVCC